MAPIRAATPPTICTAQEPAKSWNPIWLINPPPQIQCPDTGYTTRLIIRLQMQQERNLVRSAIAPETIVADVAQNTVWKIKNAQKGTPSGSIPEPQCASVAIPPIFPINPLPAPNIRPKPTSQKTGVPIQKSIRFFIIMLPAFLARVKPVSTIANPACIKKTSAAPTSTHIVFTAENSIIIFLPHKNFLIFYKMQKAQCLEMQPVHRAFANIKSIFIVYCITDVTEKTFRMTVCNAV